jgi:septal ring factor EnvC (AmiA/AmiB activator)
LKIARLIIVWVFLSSIVIPAVSLGATKTTDSQLKNIERAINIDKKQHKELRDISTDLGNDLDRLKVKIVRLAAAIQEQETTAFDLSENLQQLRKKEKDKLDLLIVKREQYSHVLMALQRMARHPPEAIIVAPISPSETVRVAILLRAAAPAIEENATILRKSIAELVQVRNQGIEKRKRLTSVQLELDSERQNLKLLLADKRKLKRKTDAKARKVKKRMLNLVEKATSLRDLISRLELDRKKRQKKKIEKSRAASLESTPHFRRKLPYPAVGRLIGRYGQAMKTGLTRKGISIETGTGAQVVVPRDGTVVFAGAFKGYGQLLIIEHDGGYLSLLAGLGRIDSAIGQQVSSGEPAGIMGEAVSGPPVLYVELRRQGLPINPLPWLAVNKIKVNG